MKKRELKYFLLFFGLSVLTRGLTLLTPTLAGDEATIGLMSLRVLEGHFSVFFSGQNFMGSLEAYLMGSFFHFFGSSPLSLEVLPVLFSLLFLILLYILTKAYFDTRTALIGIALLSIPPFFLLGWSHEARLHYHFVNIFGIILLFITHKIANWKNSSQQKRLLFIIIGLISGIAWWTNYLIITYILPISFFIFLGDKKVFFKKDFIFLPVLFLIGSLPLWIFNIIHRFPITNIGGLADASDLLGNLKELFINAFPILLGFLPPLNKDPIDFGAYLFLGLFYLAAIIFFSYRFRRELAAILSFRLPRSKGGEILLFLFLITLSINYFTNYGIRLSDEDQKYLLPLYVCLYIFTATFLREVGRRSNYVLHLSLGILLLINLTGNIRHDGWIILNSKKLFDYQQSGNIESRLVNFLQKNGYSRLYAEGRLGNRLIFHSKGNLIASHPYQEVYLRNSDQVDSSSNVAYLSIGDAPRFEVNMKAIGGGFKKVPANDGYVLYTKFTPPEEVFQRIPRNLWTGTGDYESSRIENAFDGDIATGWRSPQKQGTFLELNLGKVETVGKISYIPANYREVPVGYQVAVSLDNKNWTTVAKVPEYEGPFFWSGPNPLIKIRHGRIEIVFPPLPCRFLKISLLGDSNNNTWSINELFLFGPNKQTGMKKNILPREAEFDSLLDFLKKHQIEFAYADHWPSAVIRVKSHWKIRTIFSNYFTGDNGETDPQPEEFTKAYFNRKVALIVEQEDRGLEELLEEAKYSFRTKNLGPFLIYYDFTAPPKPTPLPVKNWIISSNVNSRDSAMAIDGNPNTRWTSGKAQEPGVYIQVDLGKAQWLKGCNLDSGKSVNDYPRHLKLFSSLDGKTWREINTTAESGLYWTGETLLKMTGTRYFFSPVQLRYLRLQQEGSDPVYYWSIYELQLF